MLSIAYLRTREDVMIRRTLILLSLVVISSVAVVADELTQVRYEQLLSELRPSDDAP